MKPKVVDEILALVKEGNHVLLFRTLSLLEEGEKPGRYDIYRELATIYPTLVEMIGKAKATPSGANFFQLANTYGAVEANFWTVMTWLNTMYINHIGCDCGGEVDLFSESDETNYRHHEHSRFREWAYKHLSDERRTELILPMEVFVKRKKT